jgi:hypothetical protein
VRQPVQKIPREKFPVARRSQGTLQKGPLAFSAWAAPAVRERGEKMKNSKNRKGYYGCVVTEYYYEDQWEVHRWSEQKELKTSELRDSQWMVTSIVNEMILQEFMTPEEIVFRVEHEGGIDTLISHWGNEEVSKKLGDCLSPATIAGKEAIAYNERIFADDDSVEEEFIVAVLYEPAKSK